MATSTPLTTQQGNTSNKNTTTSDEFPACFSPKELYNDLVINGTTTPQAFVRVDKQPPILHHLTPGKRSSYSPSSSCIPTIDMHGLMEEGGEGISNNRDNLTKLHSACKNLGLFLLKNHGVDPSILRRVKVEIEEFFKLPLEDKLRFQVKAGESQGYGQRISSESKLIDQKLDWSDRFYMFINPLSLRKPHLFPMLPSSLREALDAYIMEMQRLGMNIMGLMARALNIDQQEMEGLFEDGLQSMRMTYYPPHPEPERVIGITPHSDASGITILWQINGVGGLEIEKDGDWIPVEVPPGAFVVNVGDLMEIVSNGMYKSVEHRVSVNPEKERMSIAMFFNPKLDAEVGPSPSLISPHNPPRFKTIGMQRYVDDYFTTALDGKSYLQRMTISNVDVDVDVNVPAHTHI